MNHSGEKYVPEERLVESKVEKPEFGKDSHTGSNQGIISSKVKSLPLFKNSIIFEKYPNEILLQYLFAFQTQFQFELPIYNPNYLKTETIL